MTNDHMSDYGGIVLCGGLSRRMGRPKAWLPVGSEVMLQRVVRTLAEVVSPIVVVAAQGQELPELPDNVTILRDDREAWGPLAGMCVGLKALAEQVNAAYITACDVPLLKPAFIRRILDLLGEYEIAVPREETFYHPLAGVYRTALWPRIESLLDEKQLRPLHLIEQSRVREIPVDSLREVDPELASLRNFNTPEEYAALLTELGLSSTPRIV